jgi:hypothetical protein
LFERPPTKMHYLVVVDINKMGVSILFHLHIIIFFFWIFRPL